MTTLFWDKDNRPIEDTLVWARLFEDDDYRTVAIDVDDITDMHKMVSTIWQGLDLLHQLHVTDETAAIFETAYLHDGHVVEKFPSHSLEGALAMHNMMCHEFLGRAAAPEEGHRETLIGRRKHRG